MTPTCLMLAVLVGAAPASAVEKRLRVSIDAGHGAPGNDGNHGAYCQLEKDHTLEVALALRAQLPKLGPFDVSLSRRGAEQPSYAERIRAAERARAEVIISIHSDSRGLSWSWEPTPGQTCERNGLEPGFAVLWNDGGPRQIVESRMKVGRAIIRAMREAGFEPYSGINYSELYKPDVVTGGWVDIRPDGKNVYFLRASRAVPTVIVETHHARDVNEVAKWQKPETVSQFAAALAKGLVEAFDLESK